ncbi:1284_t:CDS:2 [Entrophospora sp. SA101]|nr:1284_t:CDS:2 [Entrophospora sp. SA101]
MTLLVRSILMFILAIFLSTTASLVLCEVLSSIPGKSCGIELYPNLFKAICVNELTSEQNSPFGSNYMLVTFGLLLTFGFVIPMTLSSLSENAKMASGYTISNCYNLKRYSSRITFSLPSPSTTTSTTTSSNDNNELGLSSKLKETNMNLESSDIGRKKRLKRFKHMSSDAILLDKIPDFCRLILNDSLSFFRMYCGNEWKKIALDRRTKE